VSSANVLIVNPKSPADNVQKFIDLARNGRVTMGIPGNGSTPHLTAELLKMSTGINLVAVPYRGGAPAMMDVIAGKVDSLFESPMSAMSHIQAGSVKAIGISSKQRNPRLPDVPAITETVPGFEATAWWGVFAPSATPKQVLQVLATALHNALRSEEMGNKLRELGADVGDLGPEAFQKLIEADTAKWAKVVKEAGIKAD
jgi:tripartite-type tricarboxylate transporter receptor subunit TctC